MPRQQNALVCVADAGTQPAGLGARLAQSLREALPMRLVLENRFAPLAAIDDLVDRAGILDSQLADHAGRVAAAASCVIIKTPLQAPAMDGGRVKETAQGRSCEGGAGAAIASRNDANSSVDRATAASGQPGLCESFAVAGKTGIE